MGGAQEYVCQMEESGFIFDMKKFWGEQLVKFIVKVWIFKIIFSDQGEDS